MFTGIIEEIGQILTIKNTSNLSHIKIKASKVLEDVKVGDSICVNGVCLTVTEFGKDYFMADIMAETKKSSAFNFYRTNMKVNLERALAVGDRFGGHVVQGHVDGVGMILGIKKVPGRYDIKIKAVKDILKNIVKKGSVTINGVSLTVSNVIADYFVVSLIPQTLKETIFQWAKNSDKVNIETDILLKK